MERIIGDQLTLFAGDSLVRTSAPPEKGPGSKGRDPVSGLKCSASSEEPDPLFASLKTFLLLELGEQIGCLLTWKNQATPDGRLWWVLSMPGPRTGGQGPGLWPTPTTQDNPQVKGKDKRGTTLGGAVRIWPTPKASPSGPDYARMNREGSGGDDLATAVARTIFPSPAPRDWRSGTGRQHNGHTPQLPEVIGGQLNPPWVEWLMGFPIGHTALKPLETPSFPPSPIPLPGGSTSN